MSSTPQVADADDCEKRLDIRLPKRNGRSLLPWLHGMHYFPRYTSHRKCILERLRPPTLFYTRHEPNAEILYPWKKMQKAVSVTLSCWHFLLLCSRY